MSTYQSVQSATSDSVALVITKPTGLAVGDKMVAGIMVNSDAAGVIAISAPVGWTLEETEDAASGAERLHVFSKTADSADVAASNFTFTQSGADSAYHMLGHIVHVTSFGIIAGETSGQGSNSTSLVVTGFTPTRANCLFIGFIGVEDISIPTITALSMATSNPTWTERAEVTFNDATRDSALAVYTATRPESTATGDFTATVGDPSSVDSYLIALALSPQVNGSITQESKINAYALSPIQTVVLDAEVEDPTFTTRGYTSWTNETKPTTTWTNEIV